MPDPLPAAEPTALEASLDELCRRHDLTTIAASRSFHATGSFFSVTVHWNGYSARNLTCATGHGQTLNEALVETLANMKADRKLRDDKLFPDDAVLREDVANRASASHRRAVLAEQVEA